MTLRTAPPSAVRCERLWGQVLWWVYQGLTGVLWPLLACRLLLAARRDRRYMQGWGERFGWVPRLPPLASGQRRVWVHAVSVGEVVTAVALLNSLRDAFPNTVWVFTTSTPTGRARAQALLPPEVPHAYMPYDLRFALRRCVARWRPAALWLIEGELWPNLLDVLHRKHIPVAVLNARMSKRSVRGYRTLRPMLAPLLRQVRLVAAQTTLDGCRYRALGVQKDRVRITGSTKCDRGYQPAWRVQADAVAQALAVDGATRPAWVAASTHDPEEGFCLEAHRRLQAQVPRAVLVLVLRHPVRANEVAECLNAGGWRWASYRAWEAGEVAAEVMQHVDVLLVDQLGVLPALYGVGHVAWVGGSMAPVGGHNPVEAALMKVALLTGPHTFNFAAMFHQLQHVGACVEVATSAALAEVCARLWSNPEQAHAMVVAGQRWLAGAQGATERTVVALHDLGFDDADVVV